MNIKMKGILLTVLMSFTLIFTGTIVEAVDEVDIMEPTLTIQGPTPKSIEEGGTVQYYLSVSDNKGVASFNVTSSEIVLNNFTANVSVSGVGVGVKTITLTNIKSTSTNADKYIVIKAGVAADAAGNKSEALYSGTFTVTGAKDIMEPTVSVQGPTPKSVESGGTVSYIIKAKDNVGVKNLYLNSTYIEKVGFSGNMTVSEDGTVTFTNVKSTTSSANKYIIVKAGAATDAAGNKSDAVYSGTFTITEPKDIMEPTVSVQGPTPKSVESGGTVSYTIKATDNVGVKNLYLNSTYIEKVGFTGTMTVDGNTVTFTNVKSTTSSANKYIIVKAGAATDAAGNKSEAVYSGTFTVTEPKDIMEPTVSVQGPTPKSIETGGTVSYVIKATDNVGVKNLYLNSTYIEKVGFTGTMTVDGNTVTFTNVKSTTSSANKYIIVKSGAATDAAGNKSEAVYSGTFTITEPKDTTKPVVTVQGPTPKSIEAGGTVSYVIKATDNKAVTNLYLNSTYIEKVGFTGTMTVSKDGTVTFTNVKSTTSSTNKYIIVKSGAATDAAGNKSEAVYSGTFTITEPKDTTKPVVTVQGPTPKSIETGGTVSYVIKATDNVGVKNLYLNSDYIEKVGFTGTMTVNGNTVTFTNVKSTTSSANKYIIVKSGAATDAAGNKSDEVYSGSFTITEAKDTTKPVVTVQGPTPKTVMEGGKVTYKITANDNVKIDKLLINSDYVEMVGFTGTMTVDGSNVTFTNVKSTSSDANKYIIVKAGAATDTSGNKSDAVYSGTFTITVPVDKDTIAPVVSIGSASPSGVYRGGKVTFVLTFTDNKAVTEVNLTANDIKLNGFTANVSISGEGLKTRTVTLTNIKGNVGSGYSITVAKGVITDAAGNLNVAVTSPKFSILKSTTTVTPTEVVNTTVKRDCIDDLSLLGDINEEITYFSSWLRAEKYTASYVQENNYVAKDERMTYMVEYYNGSTAPEPDVVFTLTIPYKVDIEEINGSGYIKSRTEKETVIEWNMGKISSKAYCRLYVRVKFNEDEDLVNSTNISKVFYATLKTTAGGNTSYSYMRQLYIDKTEGKTGTYKSYLAAIDSTNTIRPEDKITRAEFAKLLADCGIISTDSNSTAYKEYKDWESIPVYARAAVAALSQTDIIQAFPDGTFKPNNPILMEDAIQMVAQAATYISDTKLTVAKPTFLYKNALKDSYGDITDKKDYIMELMRQNVIVKYESNPDEYALRKDIVEMVNALTFRGPYVEKLPANAIKFSDIRDDSVYFYNFVGAANSYSYTYDYRLWQEITEIK